MSRFEKLEETFDLPPLQDLVENSQPTENMLEQAHELEKQFKNTDPSEVHDQEMDDIAGLAVEYGRTLHDLGMSVEVKHAGEIFTASSNMLKIALDARNSKMDKKLKLLRLELDRLKLDRIAPETNDMVEVQNVTVLDRNALLDQIRSLSQDAAK